MIGQRPYSIRTRIKTKYVLMRMTQTVYVRDHIPLEQGLRLVPKNSVNYSEVRQRPYSIRTRIKTTSSRRRRTFSVSVRDHIPLEPGLRQHQLQPELQHLQGQRPYSIRTRIKTYLLRFLMRRRRGQRPYSIRTRIKTTPWLRCLTTSRRVRDHIPLEQGLRPHRF